MTSNSLIMIVSTIMFAIAVTKLTDAKAQKTDLCYSAIPTTLSLDYNCMFLLLYNTPRKQPHWEKR